MWFENVVMNKCQKIHLSLDKKDSKNIPLNVLQDVDIVGLVHVSGNGIYILLIRRNGQDTTSQK